VSLLRNKARGPGRRNLQLRSWLAQNTPVALLVHRFGPPLFRRCSNGLQPIAHATQAM
jgi:hypothetical protein